MRAAGAVEYKNDHKAQRENCPCCKKKVQLESQRASGPFFREEMASDKEKREKGTANGAAASLRMERVGTGQRGADNNRLGSVQTSSAWEFRLAESLSVRGVSSTHLGVVPRID